MIRQCSAELVMSSFAECGGSRVLTPYRLYSRDELARLGMARAAD